MRRNETKRIALAGILAALAIVIMCFGAMIPFLTYVTPMLCCIMQCVVFRFCGSHLSWTWYTSVSILSLLLCPDKEATMAFAALGYYPLIKISLEKYKFAPVLKILFFNISVLLMYSVLIYLLGMQDLLKESMDLGYIGLAAMLVLGNLTFFILDRLLSMVIRKLR